MTKTERNHWLKSIADGKGKWSAAAQLGLHPSVIEDEMRDSPQFADDYRFAVEKSLEPALSALHDIASNPEEGPQCVAAAKLLLSHQHREFFPEDKAKPETKEVKLTGDAMRVLIDHALQTQLELEGEDTRHRDASGAIEIGPG